MVASCIRENLYSNCNHQIITPFLLVSCLTQSLAVQARYSEQQVLRCHAANLQNDVTWQEANKNISGRLLHKSFGLHFQVIS